MIGIVSLSNEVLQLIWDLVSIDDIDSLSSVCRTIRYAGDKHITKHQLCRKKYTIINPSKNIPEIFLIDIFRELSTDNSIKEYVKEVVVKDLRNDWRSVVRDSRRDWCRGHGVWMDPDNEARLLRTEENLELLASSIRTCRYIKDDKRSAAGMVMPAWAQNIEHGSEDALLGLCLLHFCNIHTLRLEHHYEGLKFALSMVRQIVSDPTTNALSKLRRLEVVTSGYNPAPSLRDAAAWVQALPSLESFYANNLDEGHTHWNEALSPSSSCATEVILENSVAPSAIVREFIGIFKAIETFKLEANVEKFKPQSNEFVPTCIITALLASSKDTLRHLTFHVQNGERKRMGPTRDFSNLVFLSTDWNLLLYGTYYPRQRLAKALPSSIQHVRLNFEPTFEVTSSIGLLSYLVDGKESQHPVLSQLELRYISDTAATALLREDFVHIARDKGLIISCDTSVNPEIARMAQIQKSKRVKDVGLVNRLLDLVRWE